MESFKLFFRFNCGNMWGLGHLYRNLALMQEMTLRGFVCEALINDVDAAKNMLKEKGVKYRLLSKELETADELLEIIKGSGSQRNPIGLVIDRLNTEKGYMDILLNHGLKVICYDNYDKSALEAKLLINTRKLLVGNVIPEYSGPAYQLLRNEVLEYAKRDKKIKEVGKKVFVHFGGTDPLHILDMAYDVCSNLKEYQFIYVAGKGAENRNELFLQTPENFTELLYEADAAIISGGVTMYEAAALGIPMLLINQNEDQKLAAGIFEKEMKAVNLGLLSETSPAKLRKSLVDLMKDVKYRKTMSLLGKKFVDGKGLNRVCDIIEKVFT